MSTTFYKLLEARFQARFGVIWIQSSDLLRVYAELKAVALEGDYSLYKWSCVEGLMEMGLTMDTVLAVGDNVTEARQVLTEVLRRCDELDREIFVLEGFLDFINYADIKVLIQKLAHELPLTGRPKHLIILSPKVVMPEELVRYIDVLEFPGATDKNYATLVQEVAKRFEVQLGLEAIDRFVKIVRGLTELETRLLLALVGVETKFGEGGEAVALREKTRIQEKIDAIELNA